MTYYKPQICDMRVSSLVTFALLPPRMNNMGLRCGQGEFVDPSSALYHETKAICNQPSLPLPQPQGARTEVKSICMVLYM